MNSRPQDWDDDEVEALAPHADELAALRERHRHDPPLDLLRASQADALPDGLLGKTKAYLEASGWSRVLVEGADAQEVSLDAAATDRRFARFNAERQRPAATPRSPWLWTSAFAVAATVILAVSIVVWRTPAPSAPSPTRDTPQTQPSSGPVFTLPLSKPDVKLTAAALVLRGEGNAGHFVDDVAQGLSAYRAGDYTAAARALEALQPRYPKAVEVMFYLGISRLMLNDAPGAVRALEAARAMNDDTFSDDAAWYLAVAYERVGAADRSRALLESLCGAQGAYAARACEAARNLR